MKKIYVLILSLFIVLTVTAQDTITVVQYNLTYYGLYNDYCTEQNNDVAQKTEYLKTIINYLKPDIFGVNEITADASYHDYLLNNVFLLNGFGTYRRSQVLGSYLTTQVFYDAGKLVEQKVYVVSAYPRDIYIHRFYFRTAGLEQGDTVFLNVIEAHLKAGNTEEDAQYRADAVANLMDFINTHGQDNYLFMGDFNLYNSSEQAYQYAINPTNTPYKFYDPGPDGYWHDNESYAMYHTQSTNYYSDNCRAGGGLDDRFDFMLYTEPLLDGTMGLQALSNTFKVVAQDGQHFNSSVDYNGNSTVPSDVLTALKSNSDHLPIMMQIYLDAQPAYTSVGEVVVNPDFEIVNTMVKDVMYLKIHSNNLLWAQEVNYTVYDPSGRQYKQGSFVLDGNRLEYTIHGLGDLPAGLYIIRFRWGGKFYQSKFIRL